MFRLVITVRRGSACGLPGAWTVYPTLEAARAGADALLRHERVARVMAVHDELPPRFAEWIERS
jgi:hypothetical protein